MKSPLEQDEQKRVIDLANTVGILRWPHLEMDHPDGVKFPLFGVANERKVKPHIGRLFKLQGVIAGNPDLQLHVPRDGFSGLYIELKRLKPRGVVSPAQKAVLKWLNRHGHLAVVCYGADHAIKTIEEYLG